MLKDSCDTEITDFDLATLSHEDVLCFKIAMENFTVVDVLDC